MSDTPLRLAVFDVDGTLVDSQNNICAAMTTAFLGEGLEPRDKATVHRIIGLSLVEAIERLLPESEKGLAPRLAERYKQAYQDIMAQPDYEDPLYPGAAEALDRLEAQGILLGLATSKSRRGVERFLSIHGYESRFVTVRSADDGPGKPHPFMIEQALKESGAEARYTAMIGDTSFDMEMGCNAGAISVGVAWGYHEPAVLAASGARLVATNFNDLVCNLTTLLGEDE
ncbi:MAG: hypothetical protein A2516_10430 [Alphaproteobacteria bacterium RIFOXYD12_FULL_60_8]|nr:MAG: hypothetical protein A2516_10430 [Alphaproteobacteria bacterium RIFOXYD12_FULL_60_8]